MPCRGKESGATNGAAHAATHAATQHMHRWIREGESVVILPAVRMILAYSPFAERECKHKGTDGRSDKSPNHTGTAPVKSDCATDAVITSQAMLLQKSMKMNVEFALYCLLATEGGQAAFLVNSWFVLQGSGNAMH
jgi:hypothetical protein